jgi:hypothetical protein
MRSLRTTILSVSFFGFLAILSLGIARGDVAGLTLVSNKMIWNSAPHNAFTDLTWFQGRFYCTFREGAAHVSPDGKIRVLSSADGSVWQSVVLLQSSAADLRDPKLSVTPSGQMMLTGQMAYNQPVNGMSYQSQVWFSGNGTSWDGGHLINKPDMWLWRPSWYNGNCYAVGEVGPPQGAYVTPWYKSSDGVNWTTVTQSIVPSTVGLPNETAIAFKADGTAYALVRRDSAPDGSALLGTATAASNYTNWTWQDLGVRVGGPDIIALPDGRLLAAVRLYNNTRTSLAWIDPAKGTLTEALALTPPDITTNADCGYAGMVLRGSDLWVSNYSSQAGKTSIYIADVRISPIPEPASAMILTPGGLVWLAAARWRSRSRPVALTIYHERPIL